MAVLTAIALLTLSGDDCDSNEDTDIGYREEPSRREECDMERPDAVPLRTAVCPFTRETHDGSVRSFVQQ